MYRSVLSTTLLALLVMSTGCVKEIFEPIEEVRVVFENNTADVIHASLPNGKDLRMGPRDTTAWYAAVSELSTVRWTFPDGTGGKTIRFRPDAEQHDANSADTWVYATGRVIE